MVRELTIKDGSWVVRQDFDLPVYLYCVEHAPSNRSRCNKCGEIIPKDALRVGIPLNDPRGTYGLISAWQHVTCTYIPEASQGYTHEKIYGFKDLTPAEQRDLLRQLSEKPQHLESIDPEACVVKRVLEEREPAKSLKQTLFSFQKKGLGWLVDRESELDSHIAKGVRPFSAGGILADEMGMGKTIQIIALILARKGNAPTLVITPVSSMLQWKEEIELYVEPGEISVCILHGQTTKLTPSELSTYDVVLTTYQTVEKQWQKVISSKKALCDTCGKYFLPRKLQVHKKYFCGDSAERTMKQKKQEKKQSFETIAKGLTTLKVIQNRLEGENAEAQSTMSNPSSSIRGITPWKIFNELTNKDGFEKTGDTLELMKSKNNLEKDKNDRRVESGKNSHSPKRGRAKALKNEKQSNAVVLPKNVKKEQNSLEGSCDEIADHNDMHTLSSPTQPMSMDTTAELELRDVEGYESDTLEFSQSPMHEVSWFRIVLDEAHRIKSKNTSTARGVYALKARYKWCVTGTPVQNRVGDMYSLIRFLRLEKFSRYFCSKKDCLCSSLSYPFTVDNHRKCIYCKHSPLMHFNFFNKHVLNPIRRYGYVGCGRKAMLLLKESVLDRIMLRRKKDFVDDLNLPPLSIKFHYVDLQSDERDFYEALYKESEAKFDSFVKKGTLLNNYAHIFDLLSSLRQALDHPLLVLHRPSFDDASGNKSNVLQNDICTICHDTISSKQKIQTKPCLHMFHKKCLSAYFQTISGDSLGCPRCFAPLTIGMASMGEVSDDSENDDEGFLHQKYPEAGTRDVKVENVECYDNEDTPIPPIGNLVHMKGEQTEKTKQIPVKKGRKSLLQRIHVQDFKTSSKLSAILQFVQNIPESDKIIIFSQYASMLDLIEWGLEKAEIKTAKLLGSMPLVMRRSMLRIFRQESSGVRIMLISLRAGGEGLNLQIANHILLVDPWWNPAVELQAIQRAHRIGQTKSVSATRFICRDTIEERMIELQEKKMLVFEGTVDSNQCSMTKLTQEDLHFLFAR